MAARDSQSVPDATGSAADTAALLELARVIKGRPSRKTLVLASVDGSTLGDAGARRFARTAEDRDRIEAVIVLSDLGAHAGRGPVVIAWSNDARRGSIGLHRTAAASVREELGAEPVRGGRARPVRPARLSARARRAGAAAGRRASRRSGSRAAASCRHPRTNAGSRTSSVDRLGQLGRAALRLASALDSARRSRSTGPRSYVAISRKVLPGWVLADAGGHAAASRRSSRRSTRSRARAGGARTRRAGGG